MGEPVDHKGRPICPTCRHRGINYIGDTMLYRPIFRCDRCQHSWTYGDDAGPFAVLIPEQRWFHDNFGPEEYNRPPATL